MYLQVCSLILLFRRLIEFFTGGTLQNRVTEEVSLDPLVNQTGNVWHVFIEGELHNLLYGYRFDGKFAPQCGQYFDVSSVVVDPYAKVMHYLYFA